MIQPQFYDLPFLVTPDRLYTFKEIDQMLDRVKISPRFVAHCELGSILNILAAFKRGVPIFPLSPREKTMPTFPLSSDLTLQTSGSTAVKYAQFDFQAPLESAKYTHPDLRPLPGSGYLLSLPLFHVAGLGILLRCLIYGGTVVLPGSDPRWVTHLSFIPLQLKRYIEKPCFPHLRSILLGGAVIPESLVRECDLPLYLSYGLTEMSAHVCCAPYKKGEGIHFGKPLEKREIHFEEGEIYMKGVGQFSGYYEKDGPFVEGFFPTSDLGEMGKHGLIVKGRKDRMFISGGENIHPERIERALLEIPEVARANVHARECAEWGMRPVAYIDSSINFSEVKERLENTLPHFMVPYLEDMHPFIDRSKSFKSSGKGLFDPLSR